MWVCKLAGGLLGYAQFPGGPSQSDGVVVTHTAFGDTGTAAPPFDKGRTSTHEIGHWLNLRHIWGDDCPTASQCSGSDLVNDTPNHECPNNGCPSFPHISCNNSPNGDMFMNYMDYTNDDCMFMFTEGQSTRMDATISGPRLAIQSSGGLDCQESPTLTPTPTPTPIPTPTPTPTPTPPTPTNGGCGRGAGVAMVFILTFYGIGRRRRTLPR